MQILNPETSCTSIVHSFRVRRYQQQNKRMSASNSAYCQARKRLSFSFISKIFKHVTQKNQTPGCAFPQLRLCALFNLYSGVTLSYRLGNKKSHELNLLREQRESFKQGDIFIGDKGFICYFDQAQLMQMGVDSIVALAKRKPVSADKAIKKLAKDDYLICLNKPKNSSQIRKRYDAEQWECLSETLTMRQIKVTVSNQGFRVKTYYILTTLLDEIKYPAEVISALYWERWQIELNFRDIKTTLGMDILKSKTPEMVEKEILMYIVVFNVMRQIIYDVSDQYKPSQFSFKSSIQTLLSYHHEYGSKEGRSAYQFKKSLLSEIAYCLLYQREARMEPRQIKRRKKPFNWLTKPRRQIINDLCLKCA